jgi:epsilon-lactone hydrolase
MSIQNPANLNEIRYSLSDDDREAAARILEGNERHFSGFKGTMREAYDAMTEQTPLAEGVQLERVNDETVKGWWVRPASAPAGRAILFLHGGAFMLGSATAYCGLASQIAARANVNTFVLDYPLAPEHPFPAAYETTLDALQWMANSGVGEIALIGDSAGGGLALAALGADGGRSLNVACVAAFSPWVDLAFTGPSFLSSETHDPVLTRPVLANAAAAYLNAVDPADKRASPLYGIPDRLPPIAFQVGTHELLLDDARRYASAAAQRGGAVQLEIYEGLHHVFQRSTRELASARHALERIAVFLSRCWSVERAGKAA